MGSLARFICAAAWARVGLQDVERDEKARIRLCAQSRPCPPETSCAPVDVLQARQEVWALGWNGGVGPTADLGMTTPALFELPHHGLGLDTRRRLAYGLARKQS